MLKTDAPISIVITRSSTTVPGGAWCQMLIFVGKANNQRHPQTIFINMRLAPRKTCAVIRPKEDNRIVQHTCGYQIFYHFTHVPIDLHQAIVKKSGARSRKRCIRHKNGKWRIVGIMQFFIRQQTRPLFSRLLWC